MRYVIVEVVCGAASHPVHHRARARVTTNMMMVALPFQTQESLPLAAALESVLAAPSPSVAESREQSVVVAPAMDCSTAAAVVARPAGATGTGHEVVVHALVAAVG